MTPADFPATLHVVSSASVFEAGSPAQVLEVTIGGQPMQLTALVTNGVLALGDYPARLLPPYKYDHAKSYDVDRTYELLLPDGSTRKYELTRLGPAAGGR